MIIKLNKKKYVIHFFFAYITLQLLIIKLAKYKKLKIDAIN